MGRPRLLARRRRAATFHIHGVTGPDEYTTVVNNNLFTNVMARDNLRQAAPRSPRLRAPTPTAYERLVGAARPRRRRDRRVGASRRRRCTIPYDERPRHPPAGRSTSSSGRCGTSPPRPTRKRPLLLHYHPLVIYRFQVLKQADVVLALFLQGDEFTPEQKRADFEYYDPLTTGDSSLSAVVQSIVAAEVGYRDLALRVLPRRRSSSTSPTCTATRPTACTSPPPAACGARWSTASAACATTTARYLRPPAARRLAAADVPHHPPRLADPGGLAARMR